VLKTRKKPLFLELRSDKGKIENRQIKVSEIRVDQGEEGQPPKLSGYFVKWDQESVDMGFIEVFRRGAFTESLKTQDVVMLWSHDSSKPLARMSKGTLTVREDDAGAYFECTPPDNSWGKDAVESIKRGDVEGVSFGFAATDDTWGTKDNKNFREVLKATLFEVSPTPFPAYPSTTVSARSFAEYGLDSEALCGLFIRAQRGLSLTTADRDLITASVQVLQSYLPPPDGSEGEEGEERSGAGRLKLLRKRLEIAEKAV